MLMSLVAPWQKSVAVQVEFDPPSQRWSFLDSLAEEPAPDDYAERRRKQRLCQFGSGCPRYAQGNTRLCISHGGGRRCETAGCTKSVQGARSRHCIAHGGGRRCEISGCSRSARGTSNRCVHHGGGFRCAAPACNKSAQRPTDFCINHGGGKRCLVTGCVNTTKVHTQFCPHHGKAETVGPLDRLPSSLQYII